MSGRRSVNAKPDKSAKPAKSQAQAPVAARRSGRRKGLAAAVVGVILLGVALALFLKKDDTSDSPAVTTPTPDANVVMPDFAGKGAIESLVTLNSLIKQAGGNKTWKGEAGLGVVRAQTPEAGQPFDAGSYALAFENGLVNQGAPNPCGWEQSQQTWQAVTNNATTPVYFFWRNTDCRESQFLSLGTDGANLTEKFPTTAAPGRTVFLPTFVGQRVVVKDPTRNVLKEFKVAAVGPCPSTQATSSFATTECSAGVAVP